MIPLTPDPHNGIRRRSGTYGGDPVACAAALGAIETMKSEDLAGRARTAGKYGNVLRFRPPLSIPDDLLVEGLDILEQAFTESA
jgi:4-aminobutyrate aminotransferase-like enzyme